MDPGVETMWQKGVEEEAVVFMWGVNPSILELEGGALRGL